MLVLFLLIKRLIFVVFKSLAIISLVLLFCVPVLDFAIAHLLSVLQKDHEGLCECYHSTPLHIL